MIAKLWQSMLRTIAALSIAVLLAITWLRDRPAPPNFDQVLKLTQLPLPSELRKGPFRLAEVWQLTSPNRNFGGYSALVRPQPGRFLALSDRGLKLEFPEPGEAAGPIEIGPLLRDQSVQKRNRDVEAAAWDAASGNLWLGLEGRGVVIRLHPGSLDEVVRTIPEWRDWGENTGPEAMTRLSDGRFVVLCECRSSRFDSVNHPAVLFPGDPTHEVAGQMFTFAGADGYRPTDMAQLPDGRVLIVMRRLVWLVPARFAIKLMLADPAEIAPGRTWAATELTAVDAPWPVDNYEALAIEPLPDGRIVAWMMSDENEAVTQRVLLLRLEFRLTDLPPKQKAPG